MQGRGSLTPDLLKTEHLTKSVEPAASTVANEWFFGATGTERLLSGTLAAGTDLSANLQRTAALSGALSGTGTLTANVEVRRSLVGAVLGSGSYTGVLL